MTTSFHKSTLGKFGAHLPCDMSGYVHLTAEAWAAAPVDWAGNKPTGDDLTEWAEEQAAATRAAVEQAEANLAEWQAK